MEEWITYSELVEIAKSKGIRPTKVSVGIWADQQGYVKVRKQIDKKQIIIIIYNYGNSFQRHNKGQRRDDIEDN